MYRIESMRVGERWKKLQPCPCFRNKHHAVYEAEFRARTSHDNRGVRVCHTVLGVSVSTVIWFSYPHTPQGIRFEPIVGTWQRSSGERIVIDESGLEPPEQLAYLLKEHLEYPGTSSVGGFIVEKRGREASRSALITGLACPDGIEAGRQWFRGSRADCPNLYTAVLSASISCCGYPNWDTRVLCKGDGGELVLFNTTAAYWDYKVSPVYDEQFDETVIVVCVPVGAPRPEVGDTSLVQLCGCEQSPCVMASQGDIRVPGRGSPREIASVGFPSPEATAMLNGRFPEMAATMGEVNASPPERPTPPTISTVGSPSAEDINVISAFGSLREYQQGAGGSGSLPEPYYQDDGYSSQGVFYRDMPSIPTQQEPPELPAITERPMRPIHRRKQP
jgi:hypothetical protein